MEKQNIVNNSSIEEIVNQTVLYVKDWTQKEFVSLVEHPLDNKSLPIILDMGGRGYVIGNYALKPTSNKWWSVSYRFNDQEHLFSSKVAAVCYAVYQQTNKVKLADKILKQDHAVGRLLLKTEQYQHNLIRAKKLKNNWNTDLFLSRYNTCQYQLERSKHELEKSLKLTKYFNIWE
jgi:hypothetical protein